MQFTNVNDDWQKASGTTLLGVNISEAKATNLSGLTIGTSDVENIIVSQTVTNSAYLFVNYSNETKAFTIDAISFATSGEPATTTITTTSQQPRLYRMTASDDNQSFVLSLVSNGFITVPEGSVANVNLSYFIVNNSANACVAADAFSVAANETYTAIIASGSSIEYDERLNNKHVEVVEMTKTAGESAAAKTNIVVIENTFSGQATMYSMKKAAEKPPSKIICKLTPSPAAGGFFNIINEQVFTEHVAVETDLASNIFFTDGSYTIMQNEAGTIGYAEYVMLNTKPIKPTTSLTLKVDSIQIPGVADTFNVDATIDTNNKTFFTNKEDITDLGTFYAFVNKSDNKWVFLNGAEVNAPSGAYSFNITDIASIPCYIVVFTQKTDGAEGYDAKIIGDIINISNVIEDFPYECIKNMLYTDLTIINTQDAEGAAVIHYTDDAFKHVNNQPSYYMNEGATLDNLYGVLKEALPQRVGIASSSDKINDIDSMASIPNLVIKDASLTFANTDKTKKLFTTLDDNNKNIWEGVIVCGNDITINNAIDWTKMSLASANKTPLTFIGKDSTVSIIDSTRTIAEVINTVDSTTLFDTQGAFDKLVFENVNENWEKTTVATAFGVNSAQEFMIANADDDDIDDEKLTIDETLNILQLKVDGDDNKKTFIAFITKSDSSIAAIDITGSISSYSKKLTLNMPNKFDYVRVYELIGPTDTHQHMAAYIGTITQAALVKHCLPLSVVFIDNKKVFDNTFADKTALTSAFNPMCYYIDDSKNIPSKFSKQEELPGYIANIKNLQQDGSGLIIYPNDARIMFLYDGDEQALSLKWSIDSFTPSSSHMITSDKTTLITLNNSVDWSTTNKLTLGGGKWIVYDTSESPDGSIKSSDGVVSFSLFKIGWQNRYLSQLGASSSIQKNLQTIYDALGNVMVRTSSASTPYAVNIDGMTDNFKALFSQMLSNMSISSVSSNGVNRISKYNVELVNTDKASIKLVQVRFSVPSKTGSEENARQITAEVCINVITDDENGAADNDYYRMFYNENDKQIVVANVANASEIQQSVNTIDKHVYDGIALKQLNNNGAVSNILLFNNASLVITTPMFAEDYTEFNNNATIMEKSDKSANGKVLYHVDGIDNIVLVDTANYSNMVIE